MKSGLIKNICMSQARYQVSGEGISGFVHQFLTGFTYLLMYIKLAHQDFLKALLFCTTKFQSGPVPTYGYSVEMNATKAAYTGVSLNSSFFN
jgi:hypothetical protein